MPWNEVKGEAEARAAASVCLLGIPWKGAEAADQSSLGEKSRLLGTELPRGLASLLRFQPVDFSPWHWLHDHAGSVYLVGRGYM